MASQYALPQKQPMTPGTPPVSPSSRAAHAMLDQPLGELVQKMAPQFAGMVPADKAKMPLREVLKSANFMEKSLIMSKMGAYLPKGVTPADIEKAVNEAPPPPEAPAAAPGAPPGAPPAAAAQAPPAPAPAPAAPPAAAKQYALPQAPAAPAPGAAPGRGSVQLAEGKSTKGVNPALVSAINRVGANYGPYDVKIISGYRGGPGQSQHGHGEAIDVQLIDRATGKPLPNYQDASHAAAYQQFAHALYNDAVKNDPALAQQLRWGGYFSGGKGKYGAFDLMHFDTANQRIGMAGGNFKDGFSPEAQRLWKVPALSTPATALASNAPVVPNTAASASADPRSAAAGAARAAELTKIDNAPGSLPTAPAAAAAPASASYFPPGTSPETIAAVNQLAAQKGLSPAAIAGVIKTESNWNQGATSPGGKYKGLTQIGPDTFREAKGGTLGGLTYDQYLKATPAQQVAAYGGLLDHYGFADKAKAAGIDFSKMSPAQQAAHLQAFQFSPAVADWQGADPSRPVTASKQASALGSTSLNDMTKYYEKMLGKVDSTPGHPDIGPVAGPPNSSDIGQAFGGGGQPSMPDPAAPPAADSATAIASAAPAADTAAPAAAAAPSLTAGLGGDAKGGGGMDGIGDIFSGLGDAFGAKGPAAMNASRPSGPSTIPMPQLPIPQGPVPMVDPRAIENQRQMLALAMQRLNSGKLV